MEFILITKDEIRLGINSKEKENRIENYIMKHKTTIQKLQNELSSKTEKNGIEND